MICPKCGALVNDNSTVCWNCNSRLANNKYYNGVQEQNPVENRSIITVGDWVVTFILLTVPIVNLVMPFVWAFSSSTPLSKKNFGKAILILWAVSFVLLILFWGSIIAMLHSIPQGGTSI